MKKLTYFFILLSNWLSLSTHAQEPFIYPSVTVTNEEKINSPLLEFSPAFFEDGILFVSNMSPGKKYQGFDKKIKKPTMSIFLSKRNDITSNLEHPEPFALELTSKMHEGPLTFDRNAEKVYFTRNDLKKRRKKSAKLKIYESIKSEDGKWSEPKELPFNLDDYDTAHPSISADGHTLIFSSNRPGGLGGMDLYKTELKDGIWSDPVNLGNQINTEKNDIFPFIHADHSLFFSSEGHFGQGGLDIFYSTLDKDDNYSTPVNLGPPINSPKDDLGFILDRDKKNGYFSSNREQGKGEDDIYGFNVNHGDIDEYFYFNHKVPDVVEDLSVSCTDADANEPIEQMKIAFLPLNSPLIDSTMLGRDRAGKIVLLPQNGTKNNLSILQKAMEENGQVGYTNAQGYLQMALPKGYYAMIAHKDDFVDKIAVVSTSDHSISLNPKYSPGCTPVLGKVVNSRGQTGVPKVTVKLVDEKNQVITETLTSENGTFDACAKCGKMYHFILEIDNQEVGSTDLDTKNTSCDKANAYNIIIPINDEAVALKEGSIIELKNIYFNFNDAAIRAGARKDLDELVDVLNKYPDMEIEIASYTDAVGSTDYNLGISQKRAEKAMEYLISKGINPDRLLAIGYGESGIRNRCKNGVKCSDKEHQFNRRIEIKVTKSNLPVKVTYPEEQATPTDDQTPPPSVNKKPDSSNEYNTFHVVIGAFLMKANAQKRRQQAINLGFDEATITSFSDTPAYHSVIIKTFDDFNEAKAFAEKIQNDHGMKYYIKKM
ncbi:MAG TPA: hypothetical protein ENK85_00170 [Saprospiraceae bacterium]|nr:hypothetical protein [Saprospiraceae bacterium]